MNGPPPLLDEEQLDELRDDLGSGFAGFVKTFLGAMRVGMEELRSGLAAGDLEAVRQTAHRLKGSAGYLGTVDLARQLALLEDFVGTGDTASAASQVETLATAFAAVEPRLVACCEET